MAKAKTATTSNSAIHRDLEINIKTVSTEAIRDIREAQEQLKKLGNIASQGSKQQGGFLSKKQVDLYKNIMKEMEASYKAHYDRLTKLEIEYSSRIDKAEQNVTSKHTAWKNAKGGDKWGNVSSEGVIGHYKKRYDESEAELKELKEMASKLDDVKEVIQTLGDKKYYAQPSSDTIKGLHQQSPGVSHAVQGAAQVAGMTGMVTSIGALIAYAGRGMGEINSQEYDGARIAQKMGTGLGNDREIRDLAQETGGYNQHTAQSTLQTQGILLSGGTSGNMANLSQDTQAVQEFGRAYGVDPGSMASDGAMLKKMGAISEGDMRKFAELIAGGIKKSGMQGREEEMMRATNNLAQSVGKGLVELKDSQLDSIVNLQATVGEAIPTLKGERGADLLNKMDSAIKGGDSSFDVIMGKGTRYKGMEGMYELEKLKEEGIANPDTLKYFMDGLDNRMGGSEEAKAFAAKEHLGISLHEWEALTDSGLRKKFASGDMSVTQKDIDALRASGSGEMADQLEGWDKTDTQRRQDNQAQNEKIRVKTARPFRDALDFVTEKWHGLPDGVQSTAILGAGLGGGAAFKGYMQNKAIGDITKTFMPTIGEQMAGKTFGSKVGGMASTALTSVGNAVGGAVLPGTALAGSSAMMLGGSTIAGVAIGGAGVVDGLGDWKESFGKEDKNERQEGRIQGTTKIGMVGAGMLAGAKAGGLLGTLLGPAGTAIGAGLGAATGGLVALLFGDSVGSSISSGWDDITEGSDAKPITIRGEEHNPELAYKEIGQGIREYDDKKKAKSSSQDQFLSVEDRLKKTPQKHMVEIIIGGKIDGMTKENEEEVKVSIKDYFANIFYSPKSSGFNLGSDQIRG